MEFEIQLRIVFSSMDSRDEEIIQLKKRLKKVEQVSKLQYTLFGFEVEVYNQFIQLRNLLILGTG